jgi:gliding motility-associated-like protein
MRSNMRLLLFIAIAMMAASSQDLFAQCGCTHFVGLTIADYQFDGNARNVKPGDKICFKTGTRTGIEFLNLKGTPENPITIANMCDGQVTIDAPLAWGNSLAFTNCQYYIVDGSANPNVEYGIEVKGGQAGLNNQMFSSNFEVHHVNVNNTGCSGMLAKTDASCDPHTWRDNFVLRDAIFHHNKISSTGCEGFYIGNSHYDGGRDLVCNGINTVVLEHDIVGVQVYDCILQDIGNDGIQVGSAKQATIHHNQVRNVGIKNNLAHQNLIQCGGGTHGAVVYNNICDTGKGYGIYDSGGGGVHYNNLIINALLGACNLQDIAPNYAPTGFRIFNNTFINCSSYGVLMYSENPDPSLYYNNIVVAPSTGTYVEVNLNNPHAIKWTESNNVRTKDITTVKFVDAASKDYHLQSASPAVNTGKDLTAYGVTFDYDEKSRPKGTGFDVGAYEFQPAGPKASAGDDQKLTLPTTSTTLSGSGTTSVGSLQYKWTKKSGAAATITNDTQPTASISGLSEGTYVFELTVTDATGFDFDDVTVNVLSATVNQNPVANAGGNRATTLPANFATLHGIGTDADGSIKSYAWSKISGPASGTLGPPVDQPNLSLTNLVPGIYTFQLTVTDDKDATGSSQMILYVNAAVTNQSPVVSAGTAKTIFLPTNSVSLTATASDPDGSIKSILWEKKSGGAATLGPPVDQLGLNITGLAVGNYTFRCTVTDNKDATAFSDVDVKVLQANQAPSVDAGASQSITLPTNTATLTAAATDPDGTIQTYAWTKVSGPTATLGATNATALSLSNLLQGTYVFGITVTDNSNATAYDEVIVAVSVTQGPPNEVPLAIAGGNFSFSLPTNSINLYGSGFDADGSIVSYVWTKQSGGPATLTNVNTPTLSVASLESGQYEFRLTVTDDKGGSDDDVAIVTVSTAGTNVFPVAEAGADQVVRLPQTSVLLDGSGTDDDGNITAFEWTEVSGAASTIVASTSASTTINGLTEGSFMFRLMVTDDKGATDINDVVIRVVSSTANVPPVANAGPDKTIYLPTTTLTLTGTASDDGSIKSTTWAKLSGPSATLVDPGELDLDLMNLVQGDYTFQLSATDNNDATVFDIVRVTVLPANFVPPIVDAGPDKQITLPVNSITLTGTATTTNGTIASTVWTKVIGGSVAMNGGNTLSLQCTDMVAGTYVFQLTATDDTNHDVTDNVQVVVLASPPNKAPFVDAGGNQSIKLPTNSITLTGTATDEDGTIATLKWTEVAGPVAATLTNQSTSVLSVGGLIEGSYIFRLTATDDKGATGTGDAMVFVDAANVDEKKPPVVFAGEDVLINLKDDVTEYSLTGNAMDPDGVISSREWTQYAGPALEFTAVEDKLTITKLDRGQFGFRFTATDDDQLSGSDDVVISVIGENEEIPKFFSPNNDGKGETWVFRNIDDYQGCKLQVFSRAGQVVYEASPYQNNWDGTYNGKPLTNGDYYYNLVCDNGKKIAGAVRIIR